MTRPEDGMGDTARTRKSHLNHDEGLFARALGMIIRDEVVLMRRLSAVILGALLSDRRVAAGVPGSELPAA